MNRVERAEEVIETMQRIKSSAGALYRTNFFPVPGRLQGWVQRRELFMDTAPDGALFLRQDRGFYHLYFSVQSDLALTALLAARAAIEDQPVVTDLIGREEALEVETRLFAKAGFRKYAHLVRLARPSGTDAVSDKEVEFAEPEQASSIVKILEGSFDPYSDQLPGLAEIQEAARSKQIVILQQSGKIGAFVHYETQGFTSTVRYWAVAPEFREAKCGSRVLRHYFWLHPQVKRFVLWVRADNENAVRRYTHFGYAPDGLADRVLANALVN